METRELLQRLHAADRTVLDHVQAALPQIERAVKAIVESLEAGGRWFNVGAGTSGRIGVLDAAELPPTFGTDPALVVGLIAGGRTAMFESQEGAEDDIGAGERDLRAMTLTGRDVVIGLAASGTTPYVIGAIRYARSIGAPTVSVICTDSTPLSVEPDISIVVATGPEVLAGSTRLKAGTAQKLVMNLLSTAVMAKRGLVVRGKMVAMRPTNAKLRRRAVVIISELLSVNAEASEQLLTAANFELPVALVSGKWNIRPDAARERIAACKGNIALALGER